MHKLILSHLNEAILLFDQSLILTYINSAGEILLADSAKHLIGLSAQQLFKDSDRAILVDLKQCLIMEEPLADRELTISQTHQNITVNLSVTPLFDAPQNKLILVELQQVDRQLKIRREKQLLAQHNASRLLVKGLAHEIKNPLGGIRGAAQLLDDELKDDELKEYTRIIIQESDRLKALMDKMLGPNKPCQKKWVNIHEIIERVRQLVGMGASSGIKIHTDYDPSIPELFADKNQLIQALLNIVQNAVQALQHNGNITLKSRVQRHMTLGKKNHKLVLKLDIIDDGPGINEDLMNQIFYPMITGRPDGTGLGLSIAQSIINQHGGLIECESQPGKTLFSIYLPLELKP